MDMIVDNRVIISTQCDFHALLTRLERMKRDLTNQGSDAFVCVENAHEEVAEGLRIYNEENGVQGD